MANPRIRSDFDWKAPGNPPGTHVHQCATCPNAALICHSLPDDCPVGDTWQCPRCELDARDAWLSNNTDGHGGR